MVTEKLTREKYREICVFKRVYPLLMHAYSLCSCWGSCTCKYVFLLVRRFIFREWTASGYSSGQQSWGGGGPLSFAVRNWKFENGKVFLFFSCTAHSSGGLLPVQHFLFFWDKYQKINVTSNTGSFCYGFSVYFICMHSTVDFYSRTVPGGTDFYFFCIIYIFVWVLLYYSKW